MKEENVVGGCLLFCIRNEQDVEGIERLPSVSGPAQPCKSVF